MFSALKDYGTARFFEERSAPGQVRCWTSAWRHTQEQLQSKTTFKRWIGVTFKVSLTVHGDLTVAAEKQNSRVIASPKKPIAPVASDNAPCGVDHGSSKVDNRTATGMSILQSEAWRHENKVRNEQALAAVVGLALFGASRSMPMFYVDDSGNLPAPTPKFDHTALKAEWKERSTGTNAAWWVCECKPRGGNWRSETNPSFYDFDEYRITKSGHHPDVIRGKVKAEYEALCKSGEIEHWGVEFRFLGTTGGWITAISPKWRTYREYRLVKRDTHPDVVREKVREKVRVEWEAREEEIANGKPVRAVRLEYKNVVQPDTEWRPCNFPVWHNGSEYRIIYLTPKKLIDMSAMPAGTNTTVGKIVGHHLFQKPGSVFTLAEGAMHVQEWQAEDVELVEKQDWIKWEATAVSECPIPVGVKYIAKYAGLPDDYEAPPVFPYFQWNKTTTGATIVAFKILGAKEGYTFNAKEAS